MAIHFALLVKPAGLLLKKLAISPAMRFLGRTTLITSAGGSVAYAYHKGLEYLGVYSAYRDNIY